MIVMILHHQICFAPHFSCKSAYDNRDALIADPATFPQITNLAMLIGQLFLVLEVSSTLIVTSLDNLALLIGQLFLSPTLIVTSRGSLAMFIGQLFLVLEVSSTFLVTGVDKPYWLDNCFLAPPSL